MGARVSKKAWRVDQWFSSRRLEWKGVAQVFDSYYVVSFVSTLLLSGAVLDTQPGRSSTTYYTMRIYG